jgi:hypothetical protein
MAKLAVFYYDKLHLFKSRLRHMQDRRNSTREPSGRIACHNIGCGTLHESYSSLFCFSLSENEFLLIFWSIYLYIIYISIYLCMALQPLVGPWPLFQFLNVYTAGRTPWTGDQPVARSLPTHRTTQTQNKSTQTSTLCVGFEPTIPAFEQANTVHTLDRAATVTG